MITAKLQLLKDTFESKFDKDKFKRFTREFFNEPEMLSAKRHTGIWKEYEQHILSYSDIAKFKDAEGNKIIVFTVELKNEKGAERARSLQRNFISKILDQQNCEAAIVAFYSENDVNWRLSFVRLDYTFKDKGLKLELTPARRYSYLVGENETSHTAQKQLYPLFQDDKHNPTLDNIEAAFSVEKVTKDFFEQYKAKYIDLKEYLEACEPFINETSNLGFEISKFAEQFAKKLMGQLAFLYFIQKKGWLGVRIMPEDHTLTEVQFKEIYMKHEDSLHRAVLDKFFPTSKTGNRKFSIRLFHSIADEEAELLSDCLIDSEFNMPWGSGNQKFIREIFDFCVEKTNFNFFDQYLEPFFYEALNKKRKNQYFKKFNCKIPFLNGGLFEPLEGYHWKNMKFNIPHEIFSNKNIKGKEADGILDIFDRFNFTINEDEPLEKEVAVDPEMLGKIFENLLDVKDRKSKGAFYTPREIVHYMCQESLSSYLVNETGVPYEDIKEFILYGELIKDADNRTSVGYGKEFTIKQTVFDKIVEIENALKNIKVADPAVGSGAFPLGMLNEIVRARNNITEYLIHKDKQGIFGRKYGEVHIRKARSYYKIKRDTIQNSIFAVDIEPSAVDIAKLRLWLSVVVEQEINIETSEPQPLPNLDCNIMVGNSLIDEYEGIKLFDESILYKNKIKDNNKFEAYEEIASAMQMSLLIDNSDDMLKEMFDLQDRYFSEDDEKKKKDIKAKIDKIRDDLIEYKLNRDGSRDGLRKYNEMKKLKMKPFFIWQLEFAKVFKENGGFDVVIGNPPYIGQSGNKDIFRDIKETSFGVKFHQRRMDLFYFFYHKGIDIIRPKGVLSFITTNYFIDATNADILRDDLKKRTTILRIINFNEFKIFESALGQHNMIMFLEKIVNEKSKVYVSTSKRQGFANNQILNDILYGKDEFTLYNEFPYSELFDMSNNCIRIHDKDDAVKSIVKKLESLQVKLIDCCNINQGIVTGCNKISKKHIEQYDGDWELNDGIYILSDSEIDKLCLNEHEYPLLKPWFKNSDIHKWNTEFNTEERVIYYSSKNQYTNVENIRKHLEKFKIILVNRNVRTGSVTLEEYNRFISGKHDISYVMIASEMKKGNYYCLSYSRHEDMFIQEKIVVPQRSKSNVFGYNNIPWYAATDVYFINPKDKNVSLKYVLALLNSKLYYLWLYTRGKRKGEILELFLKPISEIPLMIPSEIKQKEIVEIVDKILEIKNKDNDSSSKKNLKEYEELLNNKIYLLYQLTDDEITVIEKNYKEG